MVHTEILFDEEVDSDQLINNVHYWCPPVPTFSPRKKTIGTLRIAAIVGQRLFSGLRFEGDVLLLTPDNFTETIKYGKPDFLLIESCRQTVTGHWFYGQIVDNQERWELLKLIALARQNNIPVVYWFTVDHIYHDQYKTFLENFDHVFCADPNETKILKHLGVPSSTLLPAIQPALHNPFRENLDNSTFEIKTIFDGWADVLRYGDKLPINKLNYFGLKIIDSRNIIFKEKLKELPSLESKILGCVGLLDRFTLLKYCRAALSFQISLSSPTLQSWMGLETIGCRVPVIHLGEIQEGDVRKGIVVEAKDEPDLLACLSRTLEETEYREQLVQKSWRDTYEKHTFSHRISSICNEIGVEFSRLNDVSATVVTPTNRPERIQQVIDTYNRQTYLKKELIIVYNGEPDQLAEVEQEVAKIGDPSVRFISQPMELYAGACLNIGAQSSNGKYCFRMDDDDYYSEHYLSDMMLHVKSVDVDIFGKPPSHLYFEDEEKLYVRQTSTPQLTILPRALIHSGQIRLGGNSIAGKTEVFRKYCYPENSFGSADSAFLIEASQHNLQFCSVDQNNLVASRRDNGTHTWNICNDTLKRNSKIIAGISLVEFNNYGRADKSHLQKKNTDKKVVLYIGPAGYRDGVWQNRAQYIFPDLFKSLSESADIHLLTGPIPEFAQLGVRTLSEKYGVTFKELPQRKNLGKYDWWIDKGLEYGKTINADIITNIFGGVLFGYVSVKIAESLGAKAVIRVAGDEIQSSMAIGNYELSSEEHYSELRKESIAFNSADAIIVMSDRERDRVGKKCMDKFKIHVCNRGVNLTDFSPTVGKRRSKVTNFLYVGRKSLEKGYDIIEEAAKKMVHSHPDIKFWFAGTFEKEKIENRNYLGFIETEKLPELYDSIDALILSSRTEGMPQVVMEAMAKCKPCILSRHLFESQFQEGKEALFVELRADDLVEKIKILHENSELSESLARNGRAHAEKYFDNQVASKRYGNLLLGQDD